MSKGRTAFAVLIVVMGGSGVAVAASGLPDLVESAVSVSQQGRTVRVTDAVSNRGGSPATASRTGYYLARIRIGTRSVGSLGTATASRGSKAFRIPSSVPPGSWRLFACADAGARIHESNEQNNCRSAKLRVEVGDLVPPTFAGLMRATTCIPGPVGGSVRYSRYSLSWEPATDNVTPPDEISYLVYEASAAGGEDFSTPTYTTPPGATSFTTPLLPDNVLHYFVVRATDTAGNRDANHVERLGSNLCV
jgi:CARDB